MEHSNWVQRAPAVGTFSWSMDFGWKTGVIKPGDAVTDPIECGRFAGQRVGARACRWRCVTQSCWCSSPTMAGGLFSIHRDYWTYIGTYDDVRQFWACCE